MSSMLRKSSSSSSCAPHASSSIVCASYVNTEGGNAASGTAGRSSTGSGARSVMRWPLSESSSPKRRIISSKSASNCGTTAVGAAAATVELGAVALFPLSGQAAVHGSAALPSLLAGLRCRGAKACAKIFSSNSTSSSTVCTDGSLKFKSGDDGSSLREAMALGVAVLPRLESSVICKDFPYRPFAGVSVPRSTSVSAPSLMAFTSELARPSVLIPQQCAAATIR
mmetsp:Transcript_41272/g.81449  ORF Transcript_41272/g.81449 Transcript_41272/m.81449 type:complete len:225 (-) Transcript_41272:819-1493(-)